MTSCASNISFLAHGQHIFKTASQIRLKETIFSSPLLNFYQAQKVSSIVSVFVDYVRISNCQN
jgi:hypothetical protein